jgi:asparagine synthase (glutamine-hydrolysing)
MTVAIVGYTESTSALPGETDGERLRVAYRQHGENLTAHLLGQYAAVVIDRQAGRILLLQDSLGIRPLFYRITATEVIVASELDHVLRHLKQFRLNLHFFARQLATGEIATRETPFADVHKLAYGTTVVVTMEGSEEGVPWKPTHRLLRISLEEAAEELRRLLDAAVGACLPGSGTVLAELSGGLDSTSVFCTAVRFHPAMHALSMLDKQSGVDDDELYAAAVIAAYPCPWHQIDVDAHPYYAFAQEQFIAEPGGEMFASGQRAYRQILTENKIDVILTGCGGDCLFGYGSLPPIHLADPLARGDLFGAVLGARRWAAEMGGQRPWSHIFRQFAVGPALRHLRRRKVSVLEGEYPPRWLGPALRAFSGVGEEAGPDAPRQPTPGAQYLWDSVFQLAAGVNYPFRLGIAASTRHPLFHRPLVEFLLSLPPELRATASRDRVLQRFAMRGRMPPIVCERTTKGSSQAHFEQALLTNKALRSLLLNDARLVERGWVDAAAWKAQVERASFGVFNGITSFESAAIFELWLRALEAAYPACLG